MAHIKVIGAGAGRTGTSSLRMALEQLLDGPVYHMSAIPGHPFDLGDSWHRALAGQMPDWAAVFKGYVAAVDWPASLFWPEISKAYPDALVLLSKRDSAQIWWESAEATFLPMARMSLAPDWTEGTGLTDILERFTGRKQWDDPALLMAAYERNNALVRQSVAPKRLLEWQASQGWEPICQALGVAVPDRPFPWTNRRADWG